MIQQTVLRWSKLSAKLLMMQHSVKWSVWAIWAVELVKWVQILNIWEYVFNGEYIYAHSTIRLINSRWIFQALDTCMRWNCMEHCKRSIIWSFRKGSAEVDSLHSRNTQLWYYLLLTIQCSIYIHIDDAMLLKRSVESLAFIGHNKPCKLTKSSKSSYAVSKVIIFKYFAMEFTNKKIAKTSRALWKWFM